MIHSIEYLHVCGTASFVIRLVRVVLVVAWGQEVAVSIRLSIQGSVGRHQEHLRRWVTYCML